MRRRAVPASGRSIRSSHRPEVDREAADVAAVRVADDQEQALLRRQFLGRKPVDAACEVPPALRAHGGALVLRSEEHTSELQSLAYLVCRLLLEKKKKKQELKHGHVHDSA